MKVASKNDIVEVLKVAEGESTHIRICQNALEFPDERAKMAFSMIEKWGMMAALGDIMGNFEGKKVNAVPPAELVMRVCEVVDAAWNEMRHRGWIVKNPSVSE